MSTPSTLTYTVRARTLGDGVSVAEAEGRTATVSFDTAADMGGGLFGPADLLLAAFAACTLKNVERLSGLQRFAYRGASIEVTGVREDRPPRMTRVTYRLSVETDEPEQRVDLLHRNIMKHGTVYNTLAAACEVSGEIVAIRATGG